MVRLRQLERLPRGFSIPRDKIFRQNLSYVLHEHSDSEFVRSVARDCQRHALAPARQLRIATMSIEGNPASASSVAIKHLEALDYIVSAQIGTPQFLEVELQRLNCSRPIILCDTPDYLGTSQPFFNAPATLGLPTRSSSIVRVAGLLVRPGGESTHLHLSREFNLPDHTLELIREIERMILRFSDQWFAETPLWPAPAEVLLPDEVYLPG